LGQKTHPIGLRLGIIKTWNSRWFAKKDYADLLHEDLNIQKFIKDKLFHAGVPKVEIERAGQKIRVIIHTARPGIIIGKRGAEVDKLKKTLEDITGKKVAIDIKEIRKPELDAQLVAENIALQLEKRIMFRRAMKKSVATARRFGALGIKVMCGGRLAGAEIARSEWYREGRVPLHTFRSDIDYGTAEAKTTYGRIGVKVWIYKGDILEKPALAEAAGGEAIR
jgi:small subunit ribosomal protein S3